MSGSEFGAEQLRRAGGHDLLALREAAPDDGAVDQQQDHRTDDGGDPRAEAEELVDGVGAEQCPAEEPTDQGADDAADDVAVWVHPTDRALSLVLGTDKTSGLAVYDLAGRQLQFLTDGAINNVDLRYGFPLGGGHVALAFTLEYPRRVRTLTVIEPRPGWIPIGWRELWEYRELLGFLVWRDVKVRYKQTAVGASWAVLQPFATMVVLSVFLGRSVGVADQLNYDYSLFVFAGFLPWMFFATSITSATGSLVSHSQLITKVYFPREILPLTYVIAAFFDFLLGLAALMALMAWYDVALTPAALYLVPLIGLLATWIVAVSLLLSAAQVRWRDVGVAVPVLVQLGMFASPVIYPLALVPEEWRPWYLLNALAGRYHGKDAAAVGVPDSPLTAVLPLLAAGEAKARHYQAQAPGGVQQAVEEGTLAVRGLINALTGGSTAYQDHVAAP